MLISPVVADVAVRVRQLPARKCVGGKALVNQAQPAGQFGIEQFLIKIRNLRREQQTLVDNGARGKRRNVEEILLLHVGFGHSRFHSLAHDVELALERVLVHARRVADENLLDVGLRVARHPPDHVAVDRRVAPAQHAKSFLAHDLFDDSFAQQPVMRIDRKKYHAHSVLTRSRQGETQARRFALEESVGNLDQDARAIAGLRIASASAAMGEIDQNLHTFEHDVVRLPAFNIRDEPDAASVVLVLRPVQALSRWQASKWVDFLHVSRNLALGFQSTFQTPGLLFQRLFFPVFDDAHESSAWEGGLSYTSTPLPKRISGKSLSYHSTAQLSHGQRPFWFAIHRIRILN